MKKTGMFLGLVGLAVVVAAGMYGYRLFFPATGDWRYEDGIYSRQNAQVTETLTIAQIEAELARLRELPGASGRADLGVIASARATCTIELLSDRPGPEAIEAAARFFVVVSAIKNRVESPLIDPPAQTISLSALESLDNLLQLVENGEATQAQLREFDRRVAGYFSASHPTYAKLPLIEKRWVYDDFRMIVAAGQENAKRIQSCFRSQTGG